MSLQNQPITAIDSKSSVLETATIDFLCWNIKQGKKPNWREDLLNLAEGKDLVVIQEAILGENLTNSLGEFLHCSFSKGYQNKSRVTGVMTISKHQPLRQHNITCWEPWLATPKATNISEFEISGSDETLIVINIHAINFTIGVKQFRRQIDKIRKVLTEHNGPVILSGDFNTWRKKRMKILDTLAMEHELNALSFQEDHRKKVFGQLLDHIYIRSLTVKKTNTHLVNSSDHNPLTAKLNFNIS